MPEKKVISTVEKIQKSLKTKPKKMPPVSQKKNISEKEKKVVVVTGASSGIGNACAMYLAKNGYIVYGATRRPEKITKRADEFFDYVQMDMEDRDSIIESLIQIIEKHKHLDAIICCAGIGLFGAVEETPVRDAIKQFNVNFFGVARIVKAALPYLRQSCGHILVIGSLAGSYTLPFQTYYSSSKYALRGFIEGLRIELADTKVQASLIIPGASRTNFSKNMIHSGLSKDSPYYINGKKAFKQYENKEETGESPVMVARLVYKLLNMKKIASRYYVSDKKQRLSIYLRRFLPTFLYEKYILNCLKKIPIEDN